MGRHIKARELVVLKLKRKFMLNMGRGSNYFKNLRDTDLQHLLISSISRYQKKVMVLLARRKNKTLKFFLPAPAGKVSLVRPLASCMSKRTKPPTEAQGKL